MNKIYLVRGSKNDDFEWDIKAFSDLSKANSFVLSLQKQLKDIMLSYQQEIARRGGTTIGMPPLPNTMLDKEVALSDILYQESIVYSISEINFE